MPMRINGLAGRLGYQAIVEDRARLDVTDEGDGGFSIVYRPRLVMSPAVLDLSARLNAVNELADMEDGQAVATMAEVSSELAQALEDLVVESDLMDDEDTPLDFHYARLMRVDLFTLVALFNAIVTDAQGHMSKPGGTRSLEPLNGGSSPKARITNSKVSASRRK